MSRPHRGGSTTRIAMHCRAEWPTSPVLPRARCVTGGMPSGLVGSAGSRRWSLGRRRDRCLRTRQPPGPRRRSETPRTRSRGTGPTQEPRTGRRRSRRQLLTRQGGAPDASRVAAAEAQPVHGPSLPSFAGKGSAPAPIVDLSNRLGADGTDRLSADLRAVIVERRLRADVHVDDPRRLRQVGLRLSRPHPAGARVPREWAARTGRPRGLQPPSSGRWGRSWRASPPAVRSTRSWSRVGLRCLPGGRSGRRRGARPDAGAGSDGRRPPGGRGPRRSAGSP
jgi:hypothetical protein